MATSTKSGNGSAGTRQRPVFTKSYFPVQVAVFEHITDTGRKNHSVKITRTFRRDGESGWETSEYLGPSDLLPAARLLSEAYDAIQSRLEDAYRERNETE